MGMKTRIGRRIVTTICDCSYIDDGHNVKHATVKIGGDYYDLKRARNACAKKLGVPNLMVEHMEQKAYYASMPMEKFLQEADKITEVSLYKEKKG